jgi:hypothetical protein
MMKVVYIAGPFTGATAWEVECNVRRAEEMALAVAEAGAMPLCPHTNSRFFHGQRNPAFWYAGTMELLRRCDAIVLIKGWRKSTGSIAEREEALRLGLTVFDASDLTWPQTIELIGTLDHE